VPFFSRERVGLERPSLEAKLHKSDREGRGLPLSGSSGTLAGLSSPTTASSPTPFSTYRVGHLKQHVLEKLHRGEAELVLSEEGQGGTYMVVPRKRPNSGGGGGLTPVSPVTSQPRVGVHSSPPSSSTTYPIAVWKPASEEIGMPGNPRGNTCLDRLGFQPGKGYLREWLAWVLDADHFANVPETVIAEINGQVGSLQRFIPSKPSFQYPPKQFDVTSVHRIGILDLRTLNGDRHDGNMLVPKADPHSLVPIDHSYILPEGFADPDQLDWMGWPQSKVAFSQEELSYIARLDAEGDRKTVSEALNSPESGDTLYAATRALQIAAANGYTLREIAEFVRRETLTQPSGLESLISECRGEVDPDTLCAMLDVGMLDDALRQRFPSKTASD
jgi:hypothetical protein